MLQIKKIKKKYITGDLVQTALDGVSLTFRDNEFVAILGPSGSGKTTLLNVIGGLDRYDSGDLIINSISTKKYTDRDWDSYRNHTIGFVFQSYNLIPHQSVLANVELALTISGISKRERRKRAKAALESVGLGNQLHKRPSQMSGGQMQRVAIARALVNNPDILLADEPTGALDTETSVQVMDLLKEVAKDRLVIMVTHNPELAETYATRIVKVKDGKIIGDSNPYLLDYDDYKRHGKAKHQNMGKSSMSFGTALSLSFNNLRTKKGRTFLTSFAGSIGIIGIAMVLSLSTGANKYIEDIQRDTMSSYPIKIESESFDLTSMMSARRQSLEKDVTHDKNSIYSNGQSVELAANFSMNIAENNLTDFKNYLEKEDSPIKQYIGDIGIIYSYDVGFNVFCHDDEDILVNTHQVKIENNNSTGSSSMMASTQGGSTDSVPVMGAMTNVMTRNMVPSNFEELLPDVSGGATVSPAITKNYETLYGRWPENYNEVVLVLDYNNEIPLSAMYEFGLLPSEEYNELIDKLNNNEDVEVTTRQFEYSDIENIDFHLLPACDQYEKDDKGNWAYIGNDREKLEELMDTAIDLNVVGVIRPVAEDSGGISGVIGYTRALTDHIITHTDNSEIVLAQKENPEVNILNNLAFSPDDDDAKAKDAKTFLSGLSLSEKAVFSREMLKEAYKDNPMQLKMAMNMSENQLANALDQSLRRGIDKDILVAIYDNYISTGTYDENMKNFGVISLSAPSAISIYADSFENKDAISKCIEEYNENASEENQITYTDFVGLLMSSVTTIVDVISYVLIAFLAVSLVVSSIMIGIITYISVLERTKEIGILRAIGASKRNISQVFNAETFIIGLLSGLIGVGITLVLLIPSNILIHSFSEDVTAVLQPIPAIILVGLSVLLTLLGGLIPSKKAAKKDPVAALRTE